MLSRSCGRPRVAGTALYLLRPCKRIFYVWCVFLLNLLELIFLNVDFPSKCLFNCLLPVIGWSVWCCSTQTASQSESISILDTPKRANFVSSRVEMVGVSGLMCLLFSPSSCVLIVYVAILAVFRSCNIRLASCPESLRPATVNRVCGVECIRCPSTSSCGRSKGCKL